MIKSALKFVGVSLSDSIFFREAKLPTGFPDIIAVQPKKTPVVVSPSRRHLDNSHLRVLFHLHDKGGANLDDLQNELLLTKGAAKKITNDLKNALVITERSGVMVPLALRKVFIAKRIVAIEAKMQNWRKAIEQAMANLWFASHSYILLPPLKCFKRVIQEAKRFGIGVMVFNGDEVKTLSKATKRDIPSSYGSWLVNEWTLKRLIAERLI